MGFVGLSTGAEMGATSRTMVVSKVSRWSVRSLMVCILRRVFFVYMATLHVSSGVCLGRWASHILLCGSPF